MRKYKYFIFITFIIEIIYAYPNNATTACHTPNNENGVCIDIKHCKKLRVLLENQRQVPSVMAFLKKSFCGHENGIAKVCCPLENSLLDESKRIDMNESTSDIKIKSSKLPSQETCGHSNSVNNRIFGGKLSILGSWPWMVAMGYQNLNTNSRELYWLCGGTLITNTHVLTAAQCVSDRKAVRLIVARLGDLDLDLMVNDGATPLDVPIDSIIIHEMYNPRENTNDIAILKLKNSVSFTQFIRPICLPIQLDMKHINMMKLMPFVAGWGSTQELFFSSESRNTAMMEVQIPIMDINKCKEAYSNGYNVIDDRILCAGYPEGGKDSCGGDAGGPLMWPKENQYYLIGIVSYGFISCGEPNHPGVYTRVTSFIDWIVDKINDN
uniref:CLIP domain-containing serine protease n=1 Tax=Schizaphis graminum TaxID=13262 RepID=A0A2S2NGW7_SCHGA